MDRPKENQQALTFTEEESDAIYNELRELFVELDADPLIYGPKRLNGKISQARKMLDRCERIFLDVAQKLHAASRALRVATADLDLAKKQLFAEDPETRAGRSVSDREAIAAGKLKKEIEEVNRLELLVQDLEAMMVVVKAKRADLRDTQGRLRDQTRLCQEEIGLGGRWGSQKPGAADIIPKKGDVNLAGLDDIIGKMDGEFHLPPRDDDDENDDGDSGDDIEDTSRNEGDKDTEPDLDEFLSPTADSDVVDSFLDDENPLDDIEKSDSLDDQALDDLLANFEEDE